MIRRMLVPIDGSRSSGSIVPYVADLANRLDCKVDLLLVEPENGAHLPHPEHHHQLVSANANAPATEETTAENLRKANKRSVSRHAEEFEALGVHTSGHVRSGNPVDEILSAALELRCDLIAMATRHRGIFARPEKESVAEEVLWRSRLPVLLVAEG